MQSKNKNFDKTIFKGKKCSISGVGLNTHENMSYD